MIYHFKYFTLALLALALFVTATSRTTFAQKTITIAEARSLPLGTTVTIDGPLL